ncbi:hypothetical protein Pint_06920 [Pistacia integerrima]|uniref:Uncharacterized protein n=1 Tax=Pistacia integerrima TaxID=434235 RepID=A0ACC0XUH1_9ROSI|nr:hypothetical protein Pint_06920 [Pistacia integerrima]
MNKEIDQPALIPHISETSSLKYPYEVLFRSLHKELMDTATSEYLFCDDFLVEESIFYEIFAAHHVSAADPMLGFIFRQGLLSFVPCSLCNANVRTLWEDDIHRHYVMRLYAEFTASLVHLNVEYGDGHEASPECGKIQMHFEELLKSSTALFLFVSRNQVSAKPKHKKKKKS